MSSFLRAPDGVRRTDRLGRTALHLAMRKRDHELAARLLRDGADYRRRDRLGRRPMDGASLADLHAVRQRYQRLPEFPEAVPASPVAAGALADLSATGFAKVSGLVSPAQLAGLRDGFAAFIENVEAKLARGEGTFAMYDDEEYWREADDIFVTNNAFKYTSELVALAACPELLQVATHYLRKPPFVQRGYAMRYPPRAQVSEKQFGWHHDMEERRLKVMVLLTDIGEGDQYMTYARGTHTIYHPYERFLLNELDADYARAHVGAFDEERTTGRAGDIFLFDSNGMHRGNRGLGAVRDVFLLEYSANRANVWGGDIAPSALAALSPEAKHAFSRFLAVEQKKWEIAAIRPRAMTTWAETLPDLPAWV